MEYKDLTIKDYMTEVSKKTSVPGGGSVLSLALESSASLLLMVTRFTINKKGYEKFQEELKEEEKRLLEYQARCHELIDLDACSFSNLMKALKERDETKIQEASYQCIMVPKELYLLAKNLIKTSEKLERIGNKNLYSDVKIAFDLASASIQGSLNHIRLNIEYLNETQKKEIQAFLKEVEQ